MFTHVPHRHSLKLGNWWTCLLMVNVPCQHVSRKRRRKSFAYKRHFFLLSHTHTHEKERERERFAFVGLKKKKIGISILTILRCVAKVSSRHWQGSDVLMTKVIYFFIIALIFALAFSSFCVIRSLSDISLRFLFQLF